MQSQPGKECQLPLKVLNTHIAALISLPFLLPLWHQMLCAQYMHLNTLMPCKIGSVVMSISYFQFPEMV